MNQVKINLDKLDETIAKLERIKQLLEEINQLQNTSSLHWQITTPQPMPYIPNSPSTTDVPYVYPNKIYCKADTDGDTGKKTPWL